MYHFLICRQKLTYTPHLSNFRKFIKKKKKKKADSFSNSWFDGLFFKCDLLYFNRYQTDLSLNNIMHWQRKACVEMNESKCCRHRCTQQNSYSISHLLGTVITQWLDSDSIVTIDNCQQHSDWATNGCVATVLPPRYYKQWLNCRCLVTVPERWLME